MALEIEFANNGILDSLTGSPAQSVFLKQLRQAISRTDRSGAALSILTLRLSKDLRLLKDIARVKSDEIKDRSLDLIAIAQILKSSIRGGDFYTRMSQFGFWICLHGDSSEAEAAVKRFRDGLDGLKSAVTFEIFERDKSAPLASWIDEIDKSYF